MLYPKQPRSFKMPVSTGYYNDGLDMYKHFNFMNGQFHELYDDTTNSVPSKTSDYAFRRLIMDLCNSRIIAGRLLDNHQEFQLDETYRVPLLVDIIESLTIYLAYKTNDPNQKDLLVQLTELKVAYRNANRNLFTRLSSMTE